MSIQNLQQEEVSQDSLVKARIEFAERCFINAQELSRFMDQKASYILYAVALLTTALGVVASTVLNAVPRFEWQVVLKGVGLVFFLVYLVIAFLVVYNATRVFRALPHTLRRHTTAPGLIFPLILLSRFKEDDEVDSELYFNRLSQVSLTDILHDYADQIVEVANIYRHKQAQINLSTRLFQGLIIDWIVTMLVLLATPVFS